VARKQDQSRAWREPEATSASGGHLAPGMDATGPLLDSLLDPLPTKPAGDGAAVRRRKLVEKPAKSALGADAPTKDRKPVRKPAPRKTRTEPLITTPGDNLQTAPPETRRPARKRPRPSVRRVKRTLKRVGPFSVFKLSLFYYSCFLILWLGFVAVVFWIVQSMGLFDAVEEFSKGFALEWGKIDISLWLVEKWALYIGLALCLLGSLINAFLAFLYNLASDLVGGLELTFVERDN
jgi:Transmembrane domain of unknown function (DUF3566)